MTLETKYNLNNTVEYKDYKGHYTGVIYRIESEAHLEAGIPVKRNKYWVRYGPLESEFSILDEKDIIKRVLLEGSNNFEVYKI